MDVASQDTADAIVRKSLGPIKLTVRPGAHTMPQGPGSFK